MSTGVAVGVCASLLAIPVAQAGQDQKGKSTLSETIKRTDTNWIKLKKSGGEKYHVRTDMVKAKKNREKRRKSLTFFGQLTDPQIADEMSPARLELIDPIAGPTSAAWRPQEALGVRVFDSTIRNMNANQTSYVSDAKGKRAKLKFAILTGDIADSAQHNEVEMFRETLEGGVVDPSRARRSTPTIPRRSSAAHSEEPSPTRRSHPSTRQSRTASTPVSRTSPTGRVRSPSVTRASGIRI